MSSSSISDSQTLIVTLVHLGGSTQIVEVLRACQPNKLEVRWGIAGVYELDLIKNQLRDSKLKRGGQSNWRAQNLDVCKQIYWELIAPKVWSEPASPKNPALHKVAEAERVALAASFRGDMPKERA